ncbi:hypothetical protein BJV77DRAFT_804563 [Russula vinacea]|nr:hypothetical protein BJV77DRAFT_804563 [Russula vinacea]
MTKPPMPASAIKIPIVPYPSRPGRRNRRFTNTRRLLERMAALRGTPRTAPRASDMLIFQVRTHATKAAFHLLFGWPFQFPNLLLTPALEDSPDSSVDLANCDSCDASHAFLVLVQHTARKRVLWRPFKADPSRERTAMMEIWKCCARIGAGQIHCQMRL